MRRKTISAGCALVALAVALAGCGSSESKEKPSAETKPSTTSSSASSSAGGAGAYSYGSYGSGASSSTSSSSSGAGAVVLTTKTVPVFGKVLAAGPKKLTVYMFSVDHGTKSACNSSCESAWPPVIVSGTPKAGSGVISSKIGTATQSDGKKQLTYAGHLLYYYVADSNEATATGQGVTSFGGPWYVLSPSGQVITK